MPREYGFGERYAMSQGVASSRDVANILLAEIPGAVRVSAAHPTNDRQGVDWWVELSTARHLAVDAKVREEDWAAAHPNDDDLALESWSVVEERVPGWTRSPEKRCDYVLWLWKDTARFCLVPFPMLCRVFSRDWQELTRRHKVARQFTPRGGSGYHSECVFVPRREVWARIYQRYGGSLTVRSPP